MKALNFRIDHLELRPVTPVSIVLPCYWAANSMARASNTKPPEIVLSPFSSKLVYYKIIKFW